MKSRMSRTSKLATIMVFFALTITYLSSTQSIGATRFQQQSSPPGPPPATEKDIALGLNHFEAHCAGCHGETGKADTEKARLVRAANLTGEQVQAKPDDELFRIISRGVPGTAMPGFANSHSPEEIRQTILFLRKLPKLTSQERAKLEAAVPPEARHRSSTEHQHSETTEALPGQQGKDEKIGAAHQHQTPAAQLPKNPTEKEHQHQVQPSSEQSGANKSEPAHDMSHMGNESAGGNADAMMTTISGGPFKSMTAVGSGTSLQPSTTPGYMWHWMKDDWMIMAHGDLKAGLNHQGGPRGVNKAESQNWFMLMAERPAGPGRLLLRGMFSAEPWTAPKRGFPELFQTGETYKGRPIIDAQHPHDLFMELSAAYNIRLSENVALNFYGGPVAEPALGPVAFMHRMSASENPAAPLSHHWQDSTHITHGVITAGITAWRLRIESSLFHGAEPDENRKDIEMGKLDSWSGRIWFTPTPNWTMQFSYGHLVHPEAVEPGNLRRLTGSVSYNRSWSDGNWATSLIWGRNHEVHGNSNAYLLESTANFLDKNYLFTRMELVDKPGLLEENIFGRSGADEFHPIGNGFELGDHFDRFFRVGAFTFGGVRDIVVDAKLRVGIGADVTFYHVPEGLRSVYGSSPNSFHLLIRLRPGKITH